MGSFQRVVLTALPKLFLSRATGLLTRVRLPRFLRKAVYGCYSWWFGVDREAMAGQLQDYESLARFFQRPLKEGVELLHAIQDVYRCPEITVA